MASAVRGIPAAASVVGVALVTMLLAAPAVTAAEVSTPTPMGSGDARDLLTAAAASLTQPHVGRVSVVSFAVDGPRVADLDVRVDAVGGTELRRPTRWLVGGSERGWLRTTDGALSVTPAAVGARLDVDAVLDRWEATVGPPRGLDTGPATPVHLVRRDGTAVEEVVYVDDATKLPVRRETRGPDGAVLRVVAYTSLTLVELAAPAAVASRAAAPPPVDLAALAADGYEVPPSLGAGFTLLGAGHDGGMAVARYGDGLSVLSVYQQHGRLDPDDLAGATIVDIAGRDVWTWPGSEPVRAVWTGGDRTWTAVSDAPLAVIEDALASLPGDKVGHDVPSRISRGLARAWQWLRDLVAD